MPTMEFSVECVPPEAMMSDQGSHFRNQLMRELDKLLNIRKNFTTVHCAWSNGRIERLNRSTLRCFKMVLIPSN